MQFLEKRPAELRQEIFELLFETANISKFAPDEKIKYEFSMTTERDIRNQIRYAEKKGLEKGLEKGMEKGMEKGLEKGVEKVAREMLKMGLETQIITQATGLTEEQVRAL